MLVLCDYKCKNSNVFPAQVHTPTISITLLLLKSITASEYRSWLLFYSIPILKDILEESYYQHYILLVEAVGLLLNTSISEMDLQHAENLLQRFCFKFSAFYGM